MLRKPNDVMIGDRTLEDVLHDTHPNLSHTDLSNVDFSGTNLAHANLSWSNLSKSVFENTNLYDAKLLCTNLIGAKFDNAQCESLWCQGADFSYVDINRSNFRYSIISNAIISTKLEYTKIKDSDFTLARLECSNFRCAKIERSKFEFTRLEFANFSNSKITDTNFQRANLCNANFDGTCFDNVDIIGVKFDNANFGCDLSSADLVGSLIEYRKGKVLTEPIIGYKSCLTDDNSYTVVTLEIPRGSIVFSINGKKCRTNRAKVIDIAYGAKRAYSGYKPFFSYYIGDEFNIYDFDLQYNNECSTGIHFFMAREEAENY